MTQRKAKVLVQINSVGLRGSEINAVDLAASVAKHGFESILIAPRDTLCPAPSLFDVARKRGVAIELYDRPVSTMTGAAALRALARRHGADLVHVYGSWSSRPAFWGPCLLGRRPLVKTIYEMKVNADTAAVGPELIIGTGYQLAEIRGRRGGVHLISPPVDLDQDRPGAVDADAFMARWRIDPQRRRAVVVSRLDKDLKGPSIEYAIRAADVLAPTGMQLVVVGSGDCESDFRQMASAINIRHGRTVVYMTGAMSDPRAAYACADVVIGMGGSAARGLAFGKPLIVAGEFGWFRLFDRQTAKALFNSSFWSPVSSPDPLSELVHALSTLIGSDALRSDLGQFGRDFASRNFGLEAMAGKLAGVYRAAMAGYGAARWWADIPLEAGFLWRRLSGRRGYRPLFLHEQTGEARKPA